MTLANQIQISSTINGLRAYETALSLAVNVSYGVVTDDIRFEDDSCVRVEITEEHEIYIYEI